MIITISKGLLDDELRITGADTNEVISKLSSAFSVVNGAAFFMKQYGYSAPSKIYAVNQFGLFNSGMFFEVARFIKLNYPEATIDLTDDVRQMLRARMPLREFAASKDYKGAENVSNVIVPRSYQNDAVHNVIATGYGRCMFESPTGSGKSFIIANLIYTLTRQYNRNLRTLLFLPNSQLVSQFMKDLSDYGYAKRDAIAYTPATIKKYTDKELLQCPIIISNRQFLFNHIHKLGEFDAVIVDEVHSCSPGSKTEKVIKSISAPIKVGCSGTIPVDKAKYWNLLHLFGPVVYRETITNLQDDGYLANVKFTLVKIKDNTVEADKELLFNTKTNVKYSEDADIAFNAAYTAETEYMVENCMELYAPILQQLKLAKGNSLILFDRIEFGRALFEFLQSIQYNDAAIYYVDGTIPVDEREQVRSTCELQDNVIIVAQVATMSVGINIKRLSNLIMTGSNKSHSRTIQSIGRLLRQHDDKTYANIYDIVFWGYKYSRRHYNDRRALYKQYYNKSKPDDTVNIVLD